MRLAAALMACPPSFQALTLSALVRRFATGVYGGGTPDSVILEVNSRDRLTHDG